MNNYQIFISYRRDGGDALAGRLADRFDALGYKVFYDVESMRSGTFNTQILNAIAECNDVLLVLPPHALDRCVNADDWVRQELAFALKHNKNIIPIMMRGFEFPATLPVDIDKIRYMEGVTASSEYFDAVIEHLEKLLKSNAIKDFNYSLESKEYYRIKVPWNNPYKKVHSTPQGWLSVAAHIDKITRIDGLQHWKGPQKYETLESVFKLTDNEILISWYKMNIDRLNNIRDFVIALKEFTPHGKDSFDLYFYNNAVFFAIGLMKALPMEFLRISPMCIVSTLCFCVDWPKDKFGELEQVFNNDGGFSEFCELLPLAISVWPEDRVGLNSEYKKQFDQYSILLFEFMLECALLINDVYKESKHIAIVRNQILSYYKYLKKNNLYLPKKIQEKIYRYL